MIHKRNYSGVKSYLFKIFIAIGFLVITSGAFAQQSLADKLYDDYSGKEGITSVYISEFMFRLIAEMEPEDEEFKGLVNELSGIKILTVSNSKHYRDFKKNVIGVISSDGYKELMVVKEENSIVKILVKESKGKISEMIILSDEKDDASLIILQGNIDFKNISKLSKINGLEQLEDIPAEDLEK